MRRLPRRRNFLQSILQKLALLHLRVLLLPFFDLLQNKHTTLAETIGNLTNRPASNKRPPRISSHPQGPKI